MKQYTIGFQERGIWMRDDETREEIAVKFPTLGDEVELPIEYEVKKFDSDESIGTVNSRLPERDEIQMKNGAVVSTLDCSDEDSLELRVTGRKYEISRVDPDEMEGDDDELEQLTEMGITHRYYLRSSAELGKLDFFEKDGTIRAQLTLGSSDYQPFLPLVLLSRIQKDIEGKTVKEKEVQAAPQIITTRKAGEDSKFVEWVKDSFPPNKLEDAFPYMDQDGEKERFFEYMDNYTRPTLLNGPTGNGKSVMVCEYAHDRDKPYFPEKGGKSFRVQKTIGQFVPGIDHPIFAPGPLTMAFIYGGVYALEEGAPVPQDEFTELNRALETHELPINTHFGPELLHAHPDTRIVVLGNFHSNYTNNSWNDATLQRFNQIRMKYPSEENTIAILSARAPGLDIDTVQRITKIIIEMRKGDGAAWGGVHKHHKDLGLKGAVEVAQRLVMGTGIPFRDLFKDIVVNPLTTYENNIAEGGSKLYKDLMKVVDKYP